MDTDVTNDEPQDRTAGSRAPVSLAPWGASPTPLLPLWYRETLADLPVPPQLRKHNPRMATLGDLEAFWDSAKGRVSKTAMRSIVQLARDYQPPPNYVVVPSGMPHGDIAGYPLRTRTANGLVRAGLLDGHGPITVGELLSITNFGITSLLDLMCVVESAFDGKAVVLEPRGSQAVADTHATAWSGVEGPMEQLLGAAGEFLGATTVGDALRHDLGWLASEMGIASAFDAVSIRDLTSGRRIADEVVYRIESMLETMSPADRLVLEQRIYAPDPQTLEQLGQQAGVTRERIRQIQICVSRNVASEIGRQVKFIARVLHEQLGPVVPQAELDRRVEGVFGGSSPQDVLALRILRKELDYSCAMDICLDRSGVEALNAVRNAAGSVADDVGLIDEDALRDHLPGDEWNRFFPELVERCEFPQVTGRLALRNTAKARTKAAVIEIGRPAKKEEIAAVAGLDPGRIGGQLSLIPSIARADKVRWGLVEWIDDVYEGIPAEIVQRINEDGGATRLERLVEELPRLFGVSEVSVRAYVGTPQFTLHDGYVSMADVSSIALRDLNDVIDGRDANGDPYWTFQVEDRYFDGYSLHGFPSELARELGCEPNGTESARVSHPEGSGDVSVIWRLSSITGASLGYLADPLRRLRVSGGDRVRVVIKGPGVVELRRDRAAGSRPQSPDTSADSVLERMKNRRRVI